ncbi:RF-1 domain-containing protein [Pyrenochaeta sp. MPI-SDFR-AT-0127]|nr:RF-1 domain-containing protein [Pyrenochaeta sp. MPI-SDFR-AT-0127]
MPMALIHLPRSGSVRLLSALGNAFHTSTPALSKSLPPRTPLLDADLIENFLKGSGPGGQKINKTSSAVQLKHIPTGIVVKYQDTRSREINRKMARRILQDRIEELELGEDARTRVKAREMGKKKASSGKKSRRKYRALGAAKELETEGQCDEGADELDSVGKVEHESATLQPRHIGEAKKAEGG